MLSYLFGAALTLDRILLVIDHAATRLRIGVARLASSFVAVLLGLAAGNWTVREAGALNTIAEHTRYTEMGSRIAVQSRFDFHEAGAWRTFAPGARIVRQATGQTTITSSTVAGGYQAAFSINLDRAKGILLDYDISVANGSGYFGVLRGDGRYFNFMKLLSPDSPVRQHDFVWTDSKSAEILLWIDAPSAAPIRFDISSLRYARICLREEHPLLSFIFPTLGSLSMNGCGGKENGVPSKAANAP
jgi:hypothetical protein